MTGGQNDPAAFTRRDAGAGAAVMTAATLANLNKDQRGAIPHNQVDFAATHMKIAVN